MSGRWRKLLLVNKLRIKAASQKDLLALWTRVENTRANGGLRGLSEPGFLVVSQFES